MPYDLICKAVVSVAMAAATAVAVHKTKEPACLWALFFIACLWT